MLNFFSINDILDIMKSQNILFILNLFLYTFANNYNDIPFVRIKNSNKQILMICLA